MITPVPQQQDVNPVQTEKNPPCGNLNGREIAKITDVKGEALKTSLLFYLIAVCVLFLGISIGISDKNWTTGAVVTGSGAIIGVLGSRIHKEILDHEQKVASETEPANE